MNKMTLTYTKFFISNPLTTVAISDHPEVQAWLKRSVDMNNTKYGTDLVYLSTHQAYELADCLESPELPEFAHMVTALKEASKGYRHLYFRFY